MQFKGFNRTCLEKALKLTFSFSAHHKTETSRGKYILQVFVFTVRLSSVCRWPLFEPERNPHLRGAFGGALRSGG